MKLFIHSSNWFLILKRSCCLIPVKVWWAESAIWASIIALVVVLNLDPSSLVKDSISISWIWPPGKWICLFSKFVNKSCPITSLYLEWAVIWLLKLFSVISIKSLLHFWRHVRVSISFSLRLWRSFYLFLVVNCCSEMVYPIFSIEQAVYIPVM